MRPIFRNAMFGFHKEDVANFIAKQSHQYETCTSELNEKIRELNCAIEEQKKATDTQLAELDELRLQHKHEKEVYSQLLATALPLREKNKEIRSLLEEESALISSLDGNVRKLQKKVNEAENLRKKATRFDQLASVLGEIVSGKAPEKKDEAEFKSEALSQIDTSALSQCIASQKEAISALMATVDNLVDRLSELCEEE